MLKILNFFLPPVCFLCRDFLDSKAICSRCWSHISFITTPFCESCAHPFEFGEQGDHLKCGACLQDPPPFSKTRAAFKYDDFSKTIILSFKHGKALYFVQLLSEWMKNSGQDIFDGADYFIPVPLHWTRLLKRGFNQAAVLTHALEKHTHIPHDPHLLKRIKRTRSQGYFRLEERFQNVKDVFEIPTKHKPKIKNKTIILVDDVMTSGATAKACAKALLKAGAKEVRLLVAAKVQA